MTNTQHTQLAHDIASLSVIQMRDIVLDNPALFPECEGMSESELVKALSHEHAHNRHMIAKMQTSTAPTGLFIFPAFLMAGLLLAGVLMVLGL